MHGGSLKGETLKYYIDALRNKPFVYEGKLLGRRLVT
jgi:hypothetical protein